MGEIQPCPGESGGRDQAQRLGQRAQGNRALSCYTSGRKPGQENKPGGVRPGRLPGGPWPYTPPPGSGILGVRAEGQLHPLLPSGSGIPPANGGGGVRLRTLSKLAPTGLGAAVPLCPAPTQAPKAGPWPSSLPLPGLAWCVPGAGRKQTRRGGFAGSGVTLTQLQQSLMADTHSACSGGTVAVARKPAAA